MPRVSATNLPVSKLTRQRERAVHDFPSLMGSVVVAARAFGWKQAGLVIWAAVWLTAALVLWGARTSTPERGAIGDNAGAGGRVAAPGESARANMSLPIGFDSRLGHDANRVAALGGQALRNVDTGSAPYEVVSGVGGQNYRARKIQDIKTGQRVLARNPQLDSSDVSDLDIDPTEWVNVHVTLQKPDGTDLKAVLLRPIGWLTAEIVESFFDPLGETWLPVLEEADWGSQSALAANHRIDSSSAVGNSQVTNNRSPEVTSVLRADIVEAMSESWDSPAGSKSGDRDDAVAVTRTISGATQTAGSFVVLQELNGEIDDVSDAVGDSGIDDLSNQPKSERKTALGGSLNRDAEPLAQDVGSFGAVDTRLSGVLGSAGRPAFEFGGRLDHRRTPPGESETSSSNYLSEQSIISAFDEEPPRLFIQLDLPEIGVSGRAEVTAIESCPVIEQGDGRIVTATFAHSEASVIDVQIAGDPTPIGCTPNHPFWSEDRHDFVPADELRVGETLRTESGHLRQVTRITPRRGPPTPVFNLEVNGEHVYFVSANGVLVHNACNNRFIGDVAEHHVKDILKGRGYKILSAIQNASGHGLDIIAEFKTHSGRKKLVVFEVKANGSALSELQNLGSKRYVANVLKRAKSWNGPGAVAATALRDQLKVSNETIRGLLVRVHFDKPGVPVTVSPW